MTSSWTSSDAIAEAVDHVAEQKKRDDGSQMHFFYARLVGMSEGWLQIEWK